MTFYEVLDQVIVLLQRHGCVSYRSLKRQFDLYEDYLEDLKEALLYSHAKAVNDDECGFVWTEEPQGPLPNTQPETDQESVETSRRKRPRESLVI